MQHGTHGSVYRMLMRHGTPLNLTRTLCCPLRCAVLPCAQLRCCSFCKALVGDGDGGLLVREGECTSLRARRALLRSAASAGGSTSLLKQITR